MHLVMFDIDGTLVDSAGFDSELYAEAVRNVLNVEIDRDWNHYEHVSDSGILDEVLRRTGRGGDSAELAARVQRHFVALVRGHLERLPATVREIAGAKRLVERLCGVPGVGDGAWDLRACAELGYDFVAVGRAVLHPVAYVDLEETDAILAHLGVL
jgi:beta-phosphoglucomutase-like phosphatase (HAD superfamily)